MMETMLALLIGLFVAVAIYLILSRALIRVIIGMVVLGNAINLLIFVAGRLTAVTPPIVPAGQQSALGMANPLPQALILTAIVIGFAMFAYFIVLALRAHQALDADDTNQMRLAEPEGEPRPPLEY